MLHQLFLSPNNIVNWLLTDFQFWLHIHHLSSRETAIQFKIGNTNLVLKWERIYYEEGPQALYLERRERIKKINSKPRKKKLSESVEKDLIAEIQQLRM